MSTINPHYTFHYSQPDAYRFSHDSVFMARQVFEFLRAEGAEISQWHCLDLCSGTGVIGLDFLFHWREAGLRLPQRFDFLDVQEIYREHFERNAETWRSGAEACPTHFLHCNYERLLRPEFRGAYDLIVCNPPYFPAGSGRLSPSEFKNRCRFFLDSDEATLLAAVANALSPQGRCYMLARSVPRDAPKTLQISDAGDIRGTRLLLLQRDQNSESRKAHGRNADH